MLEPALPENESLRLEELTACQILETEPDTEFDELVDLAAKLCGAPIALISLVTRDTQWFKARRGLDADRTPRRVAFCAHALLTTDELFIVPDAHLDERFADNPLVVGPPHVRFYAGAPLRMHSGAVLGTLCVIDRVPRQLDAHQREALAVLGRQVVARLELRKHAHALELATLAAQAEGQAKADFLAQMSHEIRTPLTAIAGYGDLLLERVQEDPEAVEFLGAMRSGSRHLLRLVNDILDFSKLEAGKLALRPEPTDIDGLVAETLRTVEPLANAKGLELGLSIDRRESRRIQIDGFRLQQVLLNLLSNAIKFTERGRVDLSLKRGAPEDPRSALTIEVRDTGPGIDPELRARLFQAYSQGDAQHPRGTVGTGLGLFISRHLASLLGGELSASCGEGGHGSCFKLTLEANFANEQVEVETAPGLLPSGPSALRGLRILLVEDDASNERLIRLVLARAGAQVLSAPNGEAALDLLGASSASRFDLVLMDLGLPGIDGMETTRRLRAAGLMLPILAMTADALEETRLTGLANGFDGFFYKPFEPNGLIATCLHWTSDGARATA